MSQKQSLIERIFSAIISTIASGIRRQIKEYEKRVTRILTIFIIGFSLFFIGLGYLTYSLAQFLEATFGLFVLGLVGFIFILLGIVIMMLGRIRR